MRAVDKIFILAALVAGFVLGAAVSSRTIPARSIRFGFDPYGRLTGISTGAGIRMTNSHFGSLSYLPAPRPVTNSFEFASTLIFE